VGNMACPLLRFKNATQRYPPFMGFANRFHFRPRVGSTSVKHVEGDKTDFLDSNMSIFFLSQVHILIVFCHAWTG
jgi:hypothetical protein